MKKAIKIEKKHSEAWFARQEALLNEPFRNTKRYYYLPTFIFIAVFFITKDYYHGWQSWLLSFLNASISYRTWTVALLRDVGAWLPSAIFWFVSVLAQYVSYRFMVKSFANIFLCRYYTNKAYSQMADYLGSAREVTCIGPPGCGKTCSGGANFAILVAQQNWERLKKDYFSQCGMRARWLREGNVEKLQAFRALEESYYFFASREAVYIPCLASSLPLQDTEGRFSYQLTDEVALQLVRVPEYTVLFNDESGLSQGANTSRNASSDILDFYRLPRHFGDYIIINTEQGGDGNGKYIRKSTDYNIRLRRQSSIMKPEFALKWHERAKRRFYKRKAKGKYTPAQEKYIGEKLYFREEYLKTIGFRGIPYRFEATEGNLIENDEGVFIFPARGMGNYDQRAYRTLYKAKNLSFNLSAWNSMVVNESDFHKYDAQISA